MNCLECDKELSYLDHRNAMERFGLELCQRHMKRLEHLIRKKRTPVQAIQLYYALKEAGESPMLEWWDGRRSIDVALSRVRLNIEIDTNVDELSPEQALADLQESADSLEEGFTTLYIPKGQISSNLQKAVHHVLRFKESLQKAHHVIP